MFSGQNSNLFFDPYQADIVHSESREKLHRRQNLVVSMADISILLGCCILG
ncbi:hypothetical protein Hanom_Chr08g00684941 [Helianthus anomalus]